MNVLDHVDICKAFVLYGKFKAYEMLEEEIGIYLVNDIERSAEVLVMESRQRNHIIFGLKPVISGDGVKRKRQTFWKDERYQRLEI